ncbi:Calx-beta domain-containing protein [Lysobacter niabensis]|uniref:Calx-beta domain-containing protein n=1 Tax=Agrilutibacter niabensis TaxID=380628 RepID=UPI0036123B43
MRHKLIATALALFLLAVAGPASAVFHLMKVVEVFPGATIAPNAQYVVIQMYTGGQNLVGGHTIFVYDAAGNQTAQFTFAGNVPNGASQAKILIATPEAQAFFNIAANLTMSAAVLKAGGKVCFEDIDCVAWGAYTGSPSGVGTPFNASGGLQLGRAAVRRLDISGSPTTLDSTDDTDNCANDFVFATPAPRNNAGMLGSPPQATCGNGTVEGLEQCDDGNLNSGDGCSSVCRIDTPTTSLSIGNASVTEGNSGTKVMTFTVRLSQPSLSPVRYNIATRNSTAVAGSDYVARSLTGVTIPALETVSAFTVTINGDLVKEPNETFLVNVSGVVGASVADAQGVGTITNDDSSLLSVADISIAEGNSGTKVATFTLKLSQPSSTPVSYNIATANGSAVAGSDYAARTLVGETIPAGQTSRTFAVTINGDTAREANEAFSVNVTNVVNASLSDGFATATILNDDGPTLSIADVAIAEGNSGTRVATFTVKLSVASSSPVTYNIATLNGTAVAGSDYVARSLTGQSIPAGQTSRTFAVTVNGDTALEANETFRVSLSGVTGATLFDGQATGTILNDEGPTLAIGDVAIAEGNSGTKVATFTVRLSRGATSPVTYSIATANSTAIAGSDYVARSLTGQSIPAGQLSRTFSVTINGDTAREANEAFVVVLSNASGASIFDAGAIGTILNDDGPTVSIGDVLIGEGNAGTKVATFTVRLSVASTAPVTYNIATSNGTAVAGSDYVARSLNGETIAAGQTSRTFAVTLRGDATLEPNETFKVTLTGVAGATVFDGQAIGTILNDEGPTLSIGNVAIAEGNSGTKIATFTVRLSIAAASAVTYSIATLNSSAVAGSDYVARSLMGETIPAGQLTRTFNVTINGDTVVERDEVFLVSLSNASGATIFDARATGQIVNDDG